MLKSSLRQTFIANQWPWRLWFMLVPVGVAWGFLARAEVTADMLVRWPAVVWVVAVGVIGWLAGVLIAAVAGWMILGPVYHGQEVANGGPFRVGDMVYVITGRHKGRIARVYDLWQYETVRVELGEEAKAAFEDVYGGTRLLLVARPDEGREGCEGSGGNDGSESRAPHQSDDRRAGDEGRRVDSRAT